MGIEILVFLLVGIFAGTLAGMFGIGGGVIIVHDYNHNWEGIPKAIDEFMVTIPESLIELSDWQGSAMIVKN